MLNISQEDIGMLCICAIRYCHGRQTYMPLLVQRIVLGLLPKLSNKDLGILLEDCEFQKKTEMYGDPVIDKPDWLRYRKALEEEKERRASDKGR